MGLRDQTIENAFNNNLERKGVEYLRETFDNLDDKLRNVQNLDAFIKDNFTGMTKNQLLSRVSQANPRDQRTILMEELLSMIASNFRGNVSFKDLLEGITKEKRFFYDISQYMPPTAFRPYDSYPSSPNTFSIDTMKRSINEFNNNLTGNLSRVDYDTQGLEVIHNLLKTVVHAIKRYSKRDESEIKKLADDLKVGDAARGAPLEHEVTSKLFSLIVYTLSSVGKDLNVRNLKEILPTLQKYKDISAFLIYPIHI